MRKLYIFIFFFLNLNYSYADLPADFNWRIYLDPHVNSDLAYMFDGLPDDAKEIAAQIHYETEGKSEYREYKYTREQKEDIVDKFLHYLDTEDKESIRQDILDENKLNLYRSFTPNNENWSNLTELLWLEELYIGRKQLKSLPNSIGNLRALKKLVLSDNKLESLPDSIGNLTALKDLELSSNKITSLPKTIGHLKALEVLNLGDNHSLESLPASIGNLTALLELYLQNNKLTSLPNSIGNLKALTHLELNNNSIRLLPNSIGDLTALESLHIENNGLESLPEPIGNLKALTQLYLAYNNIISLPTTLRNLTAKIILINLEENQNLVQIGEGNTLGQNELRTIFDDRVELPVEKAPPINRITKDEAYTALAKTPLRINVERLKTLKLPDIPATKLDGPNFMALWQKILAKLNLSDEGAPGYLSYELLANDFWQGYRGINNKQLIKANLFPRFAGFFKTLWGLPLLPNEQKGWQMYASDVPALKNALSYILHIMYQQNDTEVLSMQMFQLSNAILHCPTGQKEGVDSMILAMQFKGLKTASSFLSKLEQFIAYKKNAIFKLAILPGENTQNVHILSYYTQKLRDELGLSSSFGNYQERIGRMGRDPFQGSEGNALQTFLKKFTAKYLVQLLMDSTANSDDRTLYATLAEHDKRFKSNLSKQELEQSIATLQRRLDKLPADSQQRAMLSKVIENNKKNIAAMQATGGLDADAINTIKSTLAQTELYTRPFKIEEIVRYLIEKQQLRYGANGLEGWQYYFTHNPTSDYINASLTQIGAIRLLLIAKILIYTGEKR
jgi:Leucine-rich repeat (LRR) protein